MYEVTLGLMAVLAIFAALLIHEFGHYWAAKLVGIRIKDVSLGFGRVLWSCRMPSGTTFSVRLGLLGGQNKLEDPAALETAPRRHRLVFYLAGMLANVIVAMLLLAVAYLLMGEYSLQTTWAVRHVTHGLGLPGHEPIVSRATLQSLVSAAILPWQMWLSAAPDIVRAALHPLTSLAGPVGIVRIGSGVIAGDGGGAILVFARFLQWTGLLCGWLAGFNLMPVFPMDGGLIVELPFGHRLSKKARAVWRAAGALLFVAFLAAAILADVLGKNLG
jgi:membrane-associated protease RseP (regulator of RpoE activity)